MMGDIDIKYIRQLRIKDICQELIKTHDEIVAIT